uniref:Uncharacterized protein n=1 Tax=Elmago virus TaxID=3077879 RepID=A0AA96HA30_9VIRU|nr:MAG: hypothetical protein [Elmago virus]
MNDSAQNKQSTIIPEDTQNVENLVIQEISQQEISGLKYTGITIKITLPFAVDSGDFLFGVNTDGFIPVANLFDGDVSSMNNIFANLFPVQVSQSNLDKVKIQHKFIPNIELMQYLSNRFCQGSVGVVVRLVSNVGQTGHLAVTHLTGVQRNYYLPEEKYEGLRFRNMPTDTFAGSLPGFALADISTNRNVSLISVDNIPTNVRDMNHKISYISSLSDDLEREKEVFESQFLEDWLIFGPTNSMPNTNGESLELNIFFDYSRVTFKLPIFPIIPTVPQSRAKQIMKISETYNDKVISSVELSTIEWLPGFTELTADKEVEEVAKIFYQLATKT